MKNENKKIRKNFQSTIYVTWLNFSEKNFFTKIEKRQRSGWVLQRGVRSIIATNNQYKHKTDVSHLYFSAFANNKRTIIENGVFAAFGALTARFSLP